MGESRATSQAAHSRGELARRLLFFVLLISLILIPVFERVWEVVKNLKPLNIYFMKIKNRG